jgi:glycosyltransferase involved in cell wall biosynthesis
MKKITAIIPTFNEAHNIKAAIHSVNWADEIIVVDSFSEDQTVEIAKMNGAKIFQRKYVNSANQKNWIIPKAAHKWIFILDADERVTPGLQKEVQKILHQPTQKDAYWINRQNFFMGKKIRYSGWQGDAVIRFFQKDKCKYQNLEVHAEIEQEGIEVGHLKNKIEHYTFKDLNHFLNKMQRYSNWSAQDHFEKTPKVTFFHLYFKPFFRFIKHYFIQLGFLDGKVGFIISAIMAWGVFLRYVKIQEKRTMSDH